MKKQPEPKVIYEDNHLLVVAKPSGWLVQGDSTGDFTLTDWATHYIKVKYKKPGNVFCQPCHRIDRPVGGLVAFARTSKALERMTKLFRDGDIEKTYLTIVEGVPKEEQGKLVHWLEKDEARNVTKAFSRQKGKSKKAELKYEVLATHGKISLLKVSPKTGRPHQIRVQMKMLGCPIRGDLKYGYPRPNQDKSIDLHSFKLAFVHPVKKEPISIINRPNWSDFEAFINELD